MGSNDQNVFPAPEGAKENPRVFSGVQGWDLGHGFYLLDDLNEGNSGGGYAMDDSGLPILGGGEDADEGGGFTNYPIPIIITNGLWL